MADRLDSGIDAIKLAYEIVGSTVNITINSGIFKHNIFDDKKVLNKKQDIIVIKGSDKNPIRLKDVLKAFIKMQEQFETVDDNNLGGRSYFYEGLEKVSETKYNIVWGS